MYNAIKINMLENCDCEYVISEDSQDQMRVNLYLYIGYGMSTIAVKAWKNGTSSDKGWLLPEFIGSEIGGWWETYLDYSDFQQAGNSELVVSVFLDGVELEKHLVFFHENLQSSGAWNVTPNHAFGHGIYKVSQVSIASSGSGGSSGGAIYTAGDGIAISEANEISAKVGNGLKFEYEKKADGTDDTTKKRRIAVKIGEGLALLDDGTMVSVPNIQNAVIIKESDAAYLLHEYKEIEYIQGNKICYGGVANPVICSGNLIHASHTTAPAISYASFERGSTTSATAGIGANFYLTVELDSINSDNRYSFNYYWGSDSAVKTRIGTFTTYHPELSGIVFNRITVYPPTDAFPYGYIQMYYRTKYTSAADGTVKYGTTSRIYVGFASESEYNAAVGLTYEPNTLTEVQETITEA